MPFFIKKIIGWADIYDKRNFMDINKLKGVVPQNVLAELPQVMNRFKIDNPLRLSHFLSQIEHESNFTNVRENLNYSAERLLQIFPKYFKTINEAKEYANKPEKIANKVYANRMGNGNEASGDGFKYAGKAYIQITGKNNVSAFDKFVDDDILGNPDLLCTKYPLLASAWFWDSVSLNKIADKGADDAIIEEVRKKVNGGLIGIDDVKTKFKKYYSILK